jgi:hypothetical protein
MASISHRYSIRWLPDAATEPTSTLVLTSQSGFYIDIRIRHENAKNPPPCLPVYEDTLLLPATGKVSGKVLESDIEIDWAFAGQSTSSLPSCGKPRHSTWQHWVDTGISLFSKDLFSDSGTMYPQKDGKTLEKGSMVNPETNKETEYEEVWEDLPLDCPANLDYESYIITLDLVDDEGVGRARSVVMQLGCWFQSVFRCEQDNASGSTKTDVSAARYKWDAKGARWDLIASLGFPGSPTPNIIEEMLNKANTQAGETLRLGFRDWKCEEIRRRAKNGG